MHTSSSPYRDKLSYLIMQTEVVEVVVKDYRLQRKQENMEVKKSTKLKDQKNSPWITMYKKAVHILQLPKIYPLKIL